MRNPRREAVLDAVRAEVDRALRHDRMALAALAGQIIGAAWFAVLWQNHFRPIWTLAPWGAFFALCLGVIVRIERAKR
ncbi:putative uncharacterized protein [Burkholderiales bacterium GJ-E10]|nr:putative uncharacterized protein [Burkholderiales bacterium GJ-E10]